MMMLYQGREQAFIDPLFVIPLIGILLIISIIISTIQIKHKTIIQHAKLIKKKWNMQS